VVKYWARQRDLNNTYHGTLSSYAYVLMCIHLLQTRNPPIVPCLQVRPNHHRPVYSDAEKEANRFGYREGDRLRRRFVTPADCPPHDCSPYSHVHVTPCKYWICPSFKGHFLSPRAEPLCCDSQLFHRCKTLLRPQPPSLNVGLNATEAQAADVSV
jgi:hypothetical protein